VAIPQRLASLCREALAPADSDAADRLAFPMLVAFILVAPWLGGARSPEGLAGMAAPVGRLVIPAFGLAIAAASFWSRSSYRSLRSFALPLGSILGIGLLGCLQLIPMPDTLLQRLAPVNLEIYHETAELMELYGRSGPPPRVSLAPWETVGTVLRLVGYAALMAAAAHLLRTRPRRRVLTGALLVAGCLHVVVAGTLLATGSPYRGAFVSEPDFGHYLLVLLLVGFGALWAEVLTNTDRGRDAIDRAEQYEQRLPPLAAKALAFATIAAGLVLTGSTCSTGASLLAVLFVLALGAGQRRGWRRAARPAGVAAAATLLAARVGALPLTGFADVDISSKLRIWEAALEAWRAFPILGAGLGAFPDAFRRTQPRGIPGLVDAAPSDFLQILVTGGAVGALLALLGVVSLFWILLRKWKAQRHREESALVLAGAGAVLALGLDGLLDFNLGATAVPATLACVLGLAIAAADGSPRERPGAPPLA
jgi:O-antigen ligase